MKAEKAKQLLGLQESVLYGKDALSEAYRKAARVTHPDHGGSCEEFAAVSLAYRTLLKLAGMREGDGIGISASVAEELSVIADYFRKAGKQDKARRAIVPDSETKIQGVLKDLIVKGGGWVLNLHGHAMQKSGVPDLFIVSSMWTGFLELKRADNVPSRLQAVQLRRICERGFPAYCMTVFENGDIVITAPDLEDPGYVETEAENKSKKEWLKGFNEVGWFTWQGLRNEGWKGFAGFLRQANDEVFV